jgi:Multicopper oxidase
LVLRCHLQDFFCLAYKADGGLQQCPQEYDNVPKDVRDLLLQHCVLRTQLFCWPADHLLLSHAALAASQINPQHRLMNLPQVMHIGANVGEVIIAARYGPSLGEFMLHCHNQVHEDHEMMRAFMVSRTLRC